MEVEEVIVTLFSLPEVRMHAFYMTPCMTLIQTYIATTTSLQLIGALASQDLNLTTSVKHLLSQL